VSCRRAPSPGACTAKSVGMSHPPLAAHPQLPAQLLRMALRARLGYRSHRSSRLCCICTANTKGFVRTPCWMPCWMPCCVSDLRAGDAGDIRHGGMSHADTRTLCVLLQTSPTASAKPMPVTSPSVLHSRPTPDTPPCTSLAPPRGAWLELLFGACCFTLGGTYLQERVICYCYLEIPLVAAPCCE